MKAWRWLRGGVWLYSLGCWTKVPRDKWQVAFKLTIFKVEDHRYLMWLERSALARVIVAFAVVASLWAVVIFGAYYYMKHSDHEYWSQYRIKHNCLVSKRSLPYAYISDGIDSDGIKHESVKTMPVRVTWKCQSDGETFYLEMEE